MIEKKIKIIRTVLENEGKSINEIAKISKIDYKSTYYIIQNLCEEKILQKEKHGKSYVIRIKRRN